MDKRNPYRGGGSTRTHCDACWHGTARPNRYGARRPSQIKGLCWQPPLLVALNRKDFWRSGNQWADHKIPLNSAFGGCCALQSDYKSGGRGSNPSGRAMYAVAMKRLLRTIGVCFHRAFVA